MNNISSTIDNLSNYYAAINDNISNYTGNAIKKIKKDVQEQEKVGCEIKDKSNVIMGWATGEQGWYDKIGGGPCDSFCRYVGLSPNIKWMCSDKTSINKLESVDKNKTGIYCYPYNKKDKESKKRGEVINGTFYPGNSYSKQEQYNLEEEQKKLEKQNAKYKMAKKNFIMYNNYSGDKADKKDIIQNKNNFSLDRCEDLCANDLNCLSFNYDKNTSTCDTSKTILNPVKSENSNYIGIKKNALSKTGVYNFYQNNACVSNNLFKKDATIENGLGLEVINGTPTIPQKRQCTNKLENDFILNKNNHIVVFPDKDSIETKCLESKENGTITLEQCNKNNQNQKWYYDSKLNTIRNDKNKCINIFTDAEKVNPTVVDCTYDINQKFAIEKSEKKKDDIPFTRAPTGQPVPKMVLCSWACSKA